MKGSAAAGSNDRGDLVRTGVSDLAQLYARSRGRRLSALRQNVVPSSRRLREALVFGGQLRTFSPHLRADLD
jgi:hypothetical protein